MTELFIGCALLFVFAGGHIVDFIDDEFGLVDLLFE